MHSAYDIALFQQSLHSFIHPPTNKSLDPNKRRRRRRLWVMERGLERQSPPPLWLRPLLLGLMIDVIVDGPILVIAVVFHNFFVFTVCFWR